MSSSLKLIFILILCCAGFVSAQNVQRIEDYPNAKSVAVVKVNVQISRVDYALLREDYPFMSNWSNEHIETWCSANLNILARTQAKQSNANTTIEHYDYIPKAAGDRSAHQPYVSGVYRPAEYGRALVIEVYDPATNKKYYFDGKGLGGERPKALPHATGLASFGEANRELTMSTMVDRALKNSGAKFSAVRSYFQFQYEFDMLERTSADHVDINRAGSVFRQNHLRPQKIVAGETDNLGGADPATSLQVEKVLRRYGISSAGSSYRDFSEFFDVTNVQITRDGLKLYDFGGYIVEKNFDKPLLEWDSLTDYLSAHPTDGAGFKERIENKRPGALSLILTRPGDKNFITPDPHMRVSFEFFGYAVSNYRSVRYDGPWIYSHNMDRDARLQGLRMIPREWVENHNQDVLEKLLHLPPANKHGSCRLLF